MHKRGLPTGVKMRHDSHYVEDLGQTRRFIGRILPVHKIEPNPEQPRTEIGDLTDLSSSIKEKGVLEPLLVKPLEKDKWLIIAGERRWRAAQMAGLNEVPCVELDLDDQSVAEVALIENLQRKDLTIWEEADALLALCHKFGYTHENLAKKLGKSRSSVTESLAIANLPLNVRQKCRENAISSKSSLLQIARKFDEREMLEVISEYNVRNSYLESESTLKPVIKKTKKDKNDGLTINVNNFPLLSYTFSGDGKEFRVEIKFKKAAEKADIISALQKALKSLDT